MYDLTNSYKASTTSKGKTVANWPHLKEDHKPAVIGDMIFVPVGIRADSPRRTPHTFLPLYTWPLIAIKQHARLLDCQFQRGTQIAACCLTIPQPLHLNHRLPIFSALFDVPGK